MAGSPLTKPVASKELRAGFGDRGSNHVTRRLEVLESGELPASHAASQEMMRELDKEQKQQLKDMPEADAFAFRLQWGSTQLGTLQVKQLHLNGWAKLVTKLGTCMRPSTSFQEQGGPSNMLSLP